MGWDANIPTTKFVGKLPLQSFNNLMGAIRERCNATGTTIPASLQTDLTKFELLPSTWFSDFQSTMTTLIPKFVNHTDNGGNWDGQTAIPAWNTTAGSPHNILSLCDTTTRITAPSSIKCAAWAWQQYQMINLTRWTLIRPTSFVDRYFTARDRWVYYGVPEPGYGTWAACETAFNAAALNAWGIYGVFLCGWHGYKDPSSGDFKENLHLAKMYFTNSSGFSMDIDIYGMPHSGISAGGSNGTFVGMAPLTRSNVLNAISSISGLTNGSTSADVEIWQKSDFISMPDPSALLPGDYIYEIFLSIHPSIPYPLWIVYKFTGAGGFTFKDW